MKIHDNHLTSLGGAGLQGTGAAGTDRTRGVDGANQNGGQRTEQRTPDGDRVQLSRLSDTLRADSEDTPERLEKVRQLKEAYQSGQYKGDSAVVSQRLVDEALGGF